MIFVPFKIAPRAVAGPEECSQSGNAQGRQQTVGTRGVPHMTVTVQEFIPACKARVPADSVSQSLCEIEERILKVLR